MSERPEWTNEPDLAVRRFGGTVMWASDELFAEKENLINPWVPVHQPETFGPRGQLYDGWETRRHRGPGDDKAVIRLGLPGVISGVVLDTAYFKGNFPPFATVEACAVPGYPDVEELVDAAWEPVLTKVSLTGHDEHFFAVDSARRYTHVRLTMHPDGGIARLRVHGTPVADPELIDPDALDLAALENGAAVTGCSDMFYSAPANMLAPGLAAHQAEGWETGRRRDGGNDWTAIRLAGAGIARFVELDTSNLKGNAPGWASVRGCDTHSSDVNDPDAWFELLPTIRLQPDTMHRFKLTVARAATHIRLDIYPDGGLARLRLHGGLTERGRADIAQRFQCASS